MTDYTVREIAEMSRRVRDWFRNAKKMPNYVYVKNNTKTLYMRDYLYLACRAVLKIPSDATITIKQTYPNPEEQSDNTVQGYVQKKDYLSVAQLIVNRYESAGKPPEWAYPVVIDGKPYTASFHNLCYLFSQILGYFHESGKVADWARLDTWSRPNTQTKTSLWLELESSLGAQFNNDKELAAAFQNHPDYQYYLNDMKTPNQTLAALKVVGGAGVNCVDVSQVVMYVLIDMGYKNVNIWRGTFNCGGHVWVTYDSDNKIFDAAGMMKYGYLIGRYMCSGTPWDLNKNPAWAVSDDGIT